MDCFGSSTCGFLILVHAPEEIPNKNHHDQKQNDGNRGAIPHFETIFRERFLEHVKAQNAGRAEGAAVGHD